MQLLKKCMLGAVAAALVLSSCASISNLSTARPVGKGNARLTAGLSKITTKSDTIPIIEQIPDFMFFELMGELGLTERFDLGIKYTFPTAAYLEGKYCVVKPDSTRGFFFTPAVRAGYTSFPHDSAESNDRMEISVPLYCSFFPHEKFGITLAPVYSTRFFMVDEARITNLAGGMFSLSIGKDAGIVIEGDYLYNFAWKWHEIQGGIGLYLPVKNLFGSLPFLN